MSAATPSTGRPITAVDTVDLARHALVEASAGTGKTYTIENLVVRLLKEEADLYLENILLVTFTEKATGELKQRIRTKIVQTLRNDGGRPLKPHLRAKLLDSLNHFDAAAIFTIHGFCHALLQMFPFETGNLFRQELTDDGPVMERLFRDQMRVEWPKRYGHRLAPLLVLSGFAADPEGFVRRTIDLATLLGPEHRRDMVHPDPARLEVARLWQTAGETAMTLKRLVGPPPRLSDQFGRLNIHPRTKTAVIRDIIAPLEAASMRIGDAEDAPQGLLPIAAILRQKQKGVRAIDRIMPDKWLKAGENLQVCPNLKAIHARLDELSQVCAELSCALMLETVAQLHRDLHALKRRNGWLSYRDMLCRVADFLDADGAEPAIQAIRSRYRVAFVDEFQDTDDVQWHIFDRLFLQAPGGARANRLFLIGDPKQAIYAFRGADVYTYLDARMRLQELAAKGQANRYGLEENWRSTPQLLTVFNRLFQQATWFGAPSPERPFEIGYTPVVSPDQRRLAGGLAADESGRPAFNVVDLCAATRHAEAKKWLAAFICNEILQLTASGHMGLAADGGRSRELNFGDIAILVRSQSEFAQIEPALQEAFIPYSYYRKPGLFQSPEAHWLSMALHAVETPEQTAVARMALLTPFFDLSPDTIANWPDIPPDHASQRLLARWQRFAQERQWGRLFQSMLEDSGMMLRHCRDAGWSRTSTTLTQLFEYLETSAFAGNLDLVDLAALLDGLRRGKIAPVSDDAIHAIEDERAKVQVLTMHMSKGLEFPVVFIAGGLTANVGRGWPVYHVFESREGRPTCRRVIDLTGDAGGGPCEKERQDEDKRLYYVALTRARVKLYVPYYPNGSNRSWSGPVCRFLSASIESALRGDTASAPPHGWHAVTAAPVLNAAAPRTAEAPRSIHWQDAALLPPQTDFRNRRIALESFSSITYRAVRQAAMPSAHPAFHPDDAAGGRDDDETTYERYADSLAQASPEDLPGGAQMGSLFHYIFENIDFHVVFGDAAEILDDAQTRRVIDASLRRYRIDTRWRPQIAQIVAATLKAPIDIAGSRLRLGNLSSAQRRHEVEFFFPLATPAPGDLAPPGCRFSADPCGDLVIRGFIDLVFEWQGRYFLADWKSNRLEAGYHHSAMQQEMASAGYTLQYQLYTVALLRWLRQQLGDRFQPQRHFGGVLYFFIRGMQSGQQTGVWHVPAKALLPLEALQATVEEKIAGLRW